MNIYNKLLILWLFLLVSNLSAQDQKITETEHHCDTCNNKGTVQKDIEIFVEDNCDICHGGLGYRTCYACNGAGIIHKSKKKRFLGIKHITRRWTERCIVCKGQGRFYCFGNCNKGKKIFKRSESKVFPCDNEKCLGGKRERDLYEKTKKKLESIRKSLEQIQLYQKEFEQEKKVQESLVKIVCDNAEQALIERQWDKFVGLYGKNNITNIIGDKSFQLYEHLNREIQDIPKEKIQETIKQYEKQIIDKK